MGIHLIDTHTHFDMQIFEADRLQLAYQAAEMGVRHLVLVGYLQEYFERMRLTQQSINSNCLKENHSEYEGLENTKPSIALDVHLASGLHPAYIHEHTEADLVLLADFIKATPHIAIGEIGLDTYTPELKTAESIAKQIDFLNAQLDLAVQHHLPVMLHIRKAHADCLKVLKAHAYDAKMLGGIAHSFSGGEQEALAFVKLGFKLGVTGQITNPNAKKLRRAIGAAVSKFGPSCLVIETDCPDMTPLPCPSVDNDIAGEQDKQGQKLQPVRNVPDNLIYVLYILSQLFDVPVETLAQQLWQNSCQALNTDWAYPV